jgi:CHAD domain-containing protein
VHQHGVRKRFKRLRYLIEFAEPLFATRKVNRMTAALKPVQGWLGLYNDELMALHAWQELAADEPKAGFGIGWLTARTQPNAKRCLKEIVVFADIKPFWRR